LLALTEQDKQLFLRELSAYQVDKEKLPELVRAASKWALGLNDLGGLGNVLVRDITTLCSVVRSRSAPEDVRLAAAALATIVGSGAAPEGTDGLSGRAFVASFVLHELYTRSEPAPDRLLPLAAGDRKLAEDIFLAHVDAPLAPDSELVVQSRAFCRALGGLAASPFLMRLVRGVRFLAEVLESGSSPDGSVWARAGLSYVLRADDSIDDRLGLVGLLDDLFVVEIAEQFIDARRAPWSRLVASMVSRWPFLGDVVIEEGGGHASGLSEFVLCNLAVACTEILDGSEARSSLRSTASVLPTLGPLPFVVAFLRSLGECFALQSLPRVPDIERFRPGDKVYVDDESTCAIYRGRRFYRTEPGSSAGVPMIVLEEVSRRGRKGVLQWRPLAFDARLLPAPSDERLRGEVPLARKRTLSAIPALTQLLHVDAPLPLEGGRQTVLVFPQMEGRRLAESLRIHGRSLCDVIPMGHVDRRGQVRLWSEGTFGSRPPLLVVASEFERAAEFISDNRANVGKVIAALEGPNAQQTASISRSFQSDVSVTSFVRAVDLAGDVEKFLREKSTEFVCWSHADIGGLAWSDHSSVGGPIARFESRFAPATTTVVEVRADEPSAVFSALARIPMDERDSPTRAQELRAECFSILCGLMRDTRLLEPGHRRSAISARLDRMEDAVRATRYVTEQESAALRDAAAGLRAFLATISRTNPKADALSQLRDEIHGLQIPDDPWRDRAKLDPTGPLAIASWLGRRKMEDLLVPPVARQTFLVLYAPEAAWYRSFTARQLDRATEHAHLDQRSRCFPLMASAWAAPVPPAAEPSIRRPEVYETLHDEALRARRGRLLDQASDRATLVEARLVLFAGGVSAFLTEAYDLSLVSHLVGLSQVPSQDARTVKIRRVDQLASGDVLLFPDGSGRDAIREEADRFLPSGTRTLAKTWQRALRQWKSRLGLSNREAYEALVRVGCRRHQVTVRNWFENEALIGPREADDLTLIATVTGDEQLAAHQAQCYEAIGTVWSAHLRAAGLLADRVVEHAAVRLSSATTVGKLEDAFLVTVEHVDPASTPTPRSLLNRLLFEEHEEDS
jgi:hypothetical protein